MDGVEVLEVDLDSSVLGWGVGVEKPLEGSEPGAC